MPVGIENLATGFLQGLNAKKQQERQDVIDQREAERFDMQKQQFTDQQAANALSMKTNQFQLELAQKTADRGDITWNQQQDEINRKKAFESDLRTIYSLEKEGNTEGLAKFLTEKNKTLGIKGDFERDYVTGKGALKLDKDGKAVFVHEDGSRTTYDMDDYGADFVAKFDPVTAISNKQKTAAEIAKEKRDLAKEIKLGGIKHSQALQLEGLRSSNQRALLEERGKLKDPKKYLSKPTQDSFYDVKETIDPYTKQKTFSKPIFNQDRYDDFMLFSHANNLDPDDNAYRLWRKYVNEGSSQAGSTASNTETYKSNSLGDLTVTGGLDKQSAGVDVSDVQKLNLGNQGAAKPASPVSGLTTRPPSQAQTNKEVVTSTKPVKKVQVLTKISGMRGSEKITKTNNPYQEIQGKFRDPIPDGFKRKKAPFGTDIRTPEYNVFVSNNYQD